MKITHVVSTFSPEHGGPTNEIRNVCGLQASSGYDITLYSLEGFSGTSPVERVPGLSVQKAFPVRYPKSLGFSEALIRQLRSDPPPDIYHIHGVWHLAQIAGCGEAYRRGIPYIYHLMGGFTLYELGRKAAKKRLARWLYQDVALRHAACIHVNGAAEADFLRSEGFNNLISVLPVGVNMAARRLVEVQEVGRIAQSVRGRKILLYLARVHPTKGIEILLDAWRQLVPQFPNWVLLVCGSGEPTYVAQVREHERHLQLGFSVFFTGQITDVEKAWCYQNASIYILPSFQENFGNTVAEALSYGLPVITTTRTPWSILKTEGCGWLSEPTSADLARILCECLSLPDDALREMGCRGKTLAREKYGLESVINQLDRLYTKCIDSNQHECVT